jgi:hypothetical protein
MNSTESLLQIETLFKSAFKRTRDRFLSYFLSSVIISGASIVLVVLGFLISGGLIFLFSLSHNAFLIGTVSTVIALVFVLAFLYLFSWWGLVVVELMIQSSKTDVVGAFKKVKPLVWNYLSTQAIIGLFILGLLPFIVLSLGVIGLLWSFWAVFVAFLFLEKNKRGMDALWSSRTLYNKKFWPITGRLLLITLVIAVLQIVLGATHQDSLRVLSWLISLVTTPFVISYNYEIYKSLDQSEEAAKNTVWTVLSVAGWIITVLLLVGFSYFAATNIPNMMKDYRYNQDNNRKQFRYNIVPSESSSI